MLNKKVINILFWSLFTFAAPALAAFKVPEVDPENRTVL